MASMGARLAAALLLAASAQACLLPPHGCFKAVCDDLKDMIVPRGGGDFGALSTWESNEQYLKLAFIRTAFNKRLGTNGPSPFTHDTWFNLLNGYNGTGAGGPPALPSVNYEYYDLGGDTVKEDAPASVTYDGVTYAPESSLSACCHACRVTEGCPMYAFVPNGPQGSKTSSNGGKCYFIKSGNATRDGPFDFTDGSDPYSPRTNNLKAPIALTKRQQTDKGRNNALFPTFFLLFLGGYCNPWKYPNGTVTDDPHFTGAHGTRFDFNGELNKAFCLLTDKKITLNAVLKGYKSDNTFGATEDASGKAIRSWIKELGLVWADAEGKEHTLHLVARSGKSMARDGGFLSSVKMDGASIDVPQEDGQSVRVGDMTFTFLGSTKKKIFDMDKFQVTIGDRMDLSFNMRAAHPKLQTADDSEVHFNVMLNDVKVTENVHGVLGQTYRNTPTQIMKAVKYSELNKLMGGPVKADGESGAGFLEGSVEDYESSHVLKADCKVSTY